MASKIYPSVRPKKGGPEREANAIAHGKFFDKDTGQMYEGEKIVRWFGALRPVDLDTF